MSTICLRIIGAIEVGVVVKSTALPLSCNKTEEMAGYRKEWVILVPLYGYRAEDPSQSIMYIFITLLLQIPFGRFERWPIFKPYVSCMHNALA